MCEVIESEKATKLEALIETIFSEFKVNIVPRQDGNGCSVMFPNYYSASIINSGYGSELGLYELAVLHDGKLDYSTPITDDVIGYLTPDGVIEVLRNIQDLQPED